MKKKGDFGDPIFRALQDLIKLAYRVEEECRSSSVSRTTRDGFPISVPGFDSRTMDWQLDVHSASGTVTESIRELYGDNRAQKTHEVFADGRSTSTLSRTHYKELLDIFCPAYLNVLIKKDLLKDLYLVCSQIEDTGMDRVERQQKEYELEATLNKETEGEHEINFKIKDVFELLKDNDSARQLLDRWLNRRHKKWG